MKITAQWTYETAISWKKHFSAHLSFYGIPQSDKTKNFNSQRHKVVMTLLHFIKKNQHLFIIELIYFYFMFLLVPFCLLLLTHLLALHVSRYHIKCCSFLYYNLPEKMAFECHDIVPSSESCCVFVFFSFVIYLVSFVFIFI